MSKVTTIRCDRCGKIPEQEDAIVPITAIRLSDATNVWAGDLCGNCTAWVKKSVKLAKKGRTGKKPLAMGTPVPAREHSVKV